MRYQKYKKIVGYIDDVEKFIEGMQAKGFLVDRKIITAYAFTVSQIEELVKGIERNYK